MDFRHVLRILGKSLEQKAVDYAVVGGLALAAYGLARTTLDLDLVVDGESQPALLELMESLGYETLYQSAGYSNHLHPDPSMGRVDFLYVRGETRSSLFAEVQRFDLPSGRSIPVPRPEHLAAMKVHAMKNDPERTLQEMSDISFLLKLPNIDREQVRRSFERHGLLERFREIEAIL